MLSYVFVIFFFFFQAEDGIRDSSVTGVQTCAIPISARVGRQAGVRAGERGHLRDEGERLGTAGSVRGQGPDGKTDIWGIIARPRNLDPSKKYPVIEDIYAGPQGGAPGGFVPKTF